MFIAEAGYGVGLGIRWAEEGSVVSGVRSVGLWYSKVVFSQ